MIARCRININGRFVVLIVGMVCAFWLLDHRPALADSPVPAALTIQPIDTAYAGDTVEITAKLTNATGGPVGAAANEVLVLYVNDVQERRMRTDKNGVATFTVTNVASGVDRVDVFYAGTKSLLPTNAMAEFTVKPAILEIQVVPPIQGVEVVCEGETYRSDTSGVIVIERAHAGKVQLQLKTRAVDTPGAHASFSRWLDDLFVPDRTVTIASKSRIQLGFDVSNLVVLHFYDPLSGAVNFSRISSVTLKSTTGVVHAFSTDEPHWLESTRITRRQSGLESAQIQWGVDSVIIDGSSVVNQGQQRFFAKPNDHWNINLLLFSAVFTARDALFGFPIGTGFEITYPSGLQRVIPFDKNGSLSLESLVRGKYEVKVAGAPGLATASPVDVSKDQEVQQIVLSYVDIGFFVGMMSFVAIWLLFVGRPTILHALGIRWPKTSDRRPFVRTGIAFLALTSGLLVAIDFQVRGDNLPLLPESKQALAQSSPDTSDASRLKTATPPRTTPSPSPYSASSSTQATPESTSASKQFSVSPVFLAFWESNGAIPVFGYPIGDAHVIDPTSGIVVQDFERARLEFHPEFAHTPYEFQLSLLGVYSATSRNLLGTDPFQPVGPDSSTIETGGQDCEYFGTTRHSVCGAFLDYWKHHGLEFGDPGVSNREALALYGYPISESFVDPDTGIIVQYFERARFEFHPENPEPHTVLLSQLQQGAP